MISNGFISSKIHHLENAANVGTIQLLEALNPGIRYCWSPEFDEITSQSVARCLDNEAPETVLFTRSNVSVITYVVTYMYL